jgi:hypothetical protein
MSEDEEESVDLEMGNWRRMGRGEYLHTVVATWDEEKMEGEDWEPGTAVHLDTTIKDLNDMRLGAGRNRSSIDIGDLQELTCTSLRPNGGPKGPSGRDSR